MRNKLFLCACVTGLIWHAPVRAVDVDNPPVGVFQDEWSAILLHGQKCGHMHIKMERGEQDGVDVIKTTNDMVMSFKRDEIELKLTFSKRAAETLKGQPLSFWNSMKTGLVEVVKEGKISNGKVFVRINQFGQETQKTYDLPEGARMEWAIYCEQLKRGFKPGTKYSLAVYEPFVDLNSLTPMGVEILGREVVDVFGRKAEAVKVRQTTQIKSTFGGTVEEEALVWMTNEGDCLRMDMEIMGIPVQILSCSKSVATAKDGPVELMVRTFIKANKSIDAAGLSSVTYRLRWKGEVGKAALSDIPETAMQKIVKKGPKGVTLKVTRRPAERVKGKGPPLSKEDKELYLAATSVVNYKDPVVDKLAKQAAGKEKDAWKLADRLRRFVSDYVQNKSLSVGFATASEVARSREGDCTEHGVLLAALGRAAGIPSRVVTGIVYTDEFLGQRGVFVGHLWTQFWIDGQWVDLDASLKQTIVDPSRIAMGIGTAADDGLADLVNSIWLNMDKLEVKILGSE